MITVKPAREPGDNIRPDISRIFTDGFYRWLKFFNKDKEKLGRAFSHIFNLDVFYIAVVDGEIAGIAACTDGKSPSVRLNRRELKRHLGFFMGSIAYAVLRKEFEQKQYPFAIAEGMAAVEFVATAAAHRGKGVATAIIRHIFTATPYREYVLEVADTNENAVRLYEKLGFTEFMRVREPHSKQSGLNFYVYMKALKDNCGNLPAGTGNQL